MNKLEHLSLAQSESYVQNKLELGERQILAAHLEVCAFCKGNLQSLNEPTMPSLPNVGAFLANIVSLLHECAVLVWPMPIAAMLVVLSVTVIDQLYLQHRMKHRASTTQTHPAPTSTPVPKLVKIH